MKETFWLIHVAVNETFCHVVNETFWMMNDPFWLENQV